MKKIFWYSLLPALAIVLFVAARDASPIANPASQDPSTEWPEDVVALLERACYDCHTSESGNLKAKQKLNFSKWGDYKLSKMVGKLSEIAEEVEEGKMPPEKYIEKNPNRTLSDEEMKRLVDWAKAESEKLMEE